MLWHIVRFTFADEVTEEDRVAAEERLRGLPEAIDGLEFVRVARDLADPSVTGLIAGLRDAEALEVYRDHPAHVPVATRLRELSRDVVRLDVVTDDAPDALR